MFSSYLCILKTSAKSTFMKRILSLTITLLCLCNIVVAQKNITISGTIKDGEGKVVELYRYSDKISCYEVLEDSVTVGEDLRFELQTYANYPMLVFLQVENYSQSFYVEPGRTYKVHIGDFDWNVDETKNVFLDPVALPLEFVNLPEDDINILIDRFDRAVDQYVLAHRGVFDQRFRPQPKYFDSLVLEMNRVCPDVEDCDFFNRYKRYTLAKMKMDMRIVSRTKIFNEYIKDQPVICHDENYMSLFAALYSNSISKGSKHWSIHRLAHWVYNLDLDTYIDSLGADPLLRHEQVRELAALQALKESYYNYQYYDADMVVKMVEQIGRRTKFNEHKPIAENILKGFKRVQQGSDVGSFTLPDIEKNLVSLDSFQHKWVYIAFVRVGDPNCIGELETMAHFLDTVYRATDSIDFLTIVCDREYQKMFHFLKNSKHDDHYNWTWLHFDGNYDLLRHFGVCVYPSFALVTPDGRLYSEVTPAPSTGFLLTGPWWPKTKQNVKRSLIYEHIENK